MVTLSKEAYGLSILAAFVIGIAFMVMINLIRSQLEANRAYKRELERNRIENLRAEIHADIMKALNGESLDEDEDTDTEYIEVQDATQPVRLHRQQDE